MASIYMRKGRYNVVWKYQKDDGSWGQKWEPFEVEEEAKIRKAELEFQKATNNMLVPNNITVKDFMLQKFFPVYGIKKWSPKTYETNVGLSQNHIFPHIGQKPIQSIKPFDVEVLHNILAKTKKGQYVKGCKQNLGNKDNGYLSKKTIREALLVLFTALKQAVEWRLIRECPMKEVPQSPKGKSRAFWSVDTMRDALELLEDTPLLHLAIHLIFSCSLRNGEACGILIKNINLDREKAEILIDQTIQRIRKDTIDKIDQSKISTIFPSKINKASVLISKSPKTKAGERTVYITNLLRDEILQRFEDIERNKQHFGKDYHDYGLLICLPNGDPIEPKLLLQYFEKWQKRTGKNFPPIAVHGLRHSSTNFKLSISDGDFKSIQGDFGWASVQMVEHYSHVEDDRRKQLNTKFEQEFYKVNSKKATDESVVHSVLNNPHLRQQLLLALLSDNA